MENVKFIFMIIYKIKNSVNNKLYIGATKGTAKDRFAQHINSCNNGSKLSIHCAMRKYGWSNFSIEVVDDSAKTEEELKNLETKYINEYNTLDSNIGYNELTNNYNTSKISISGISDADVMEIRKLYKSCTYGPKHWYNKFYKDKLSYSGFEKIWEGTSWAHIMPEVYTEKRITYYKKHKEGKNGEFNSNTIFSNDEVLEMRKYYVNHSLDEVWEKFGKDKIHKTSLSNILKGRTYKNVPSYRKRSKQWVLNGVKVNIDKYKPVSTISESGE